VNEPELKSKMPRAIIKVCSKGLVGRIGIGFAEAEVDGDEGVGVT
jgi:hypothetical protein